MSNNMFQEVLTNVSSAKDKYIGPDYPYYNFIKTPDQLGMSGKGSLQQLQKDIDGLISYVEVLVTGKSKASKTGGPLGNKFFLKTGGKCKDIKTEEEKDRYIYINNVPQGNIPFISSGLGVNFKEFRGLIPGTISNLNAFNPLTIFQSFLLGSTPECQELTMETIDINNNKSTETHHVTLVDIRNIDPCSFPKGKNILTGRSCVKGFRNMNDTPEEIEYVSLLPKIPDDLLAKIYFASLGGLGIYLLYKTMLKVKMIPK